MADIGRNDPCTCGSGKKYKKCCETKDVAKKHTEMEKSWNKSVKEFEKQKKDDEATNPAAPVVPGKHPPHMMGNLKSQKHNPSVAPKFNMPRKAGGGGS